MNHTIEPEHKQHNQMNHTVEPEKDSQMNHTAEPEHNQDSQMNQTVEPEYKPSESPGWTKTQTRQLNESNNYVLQKVISCNRKRL